MAEKPAHCCQVRRHVTTVVKVATPLNHRICSQTYNAVPVNYCRLTQTSPGETVYEARKHDGDGMAVVGAS